MDAYLRVIPITVEAIIPGFILQLPVYVEVAESLCGRLIWRILSKVLIGVDVDVLHFVLYNEVRLLE
mgnify:FL=1